MKNLQGGAHLNEMELAWRSCSVSNLYQNVSTNELMKGLKLTICYLNSIGTLKTSINSVLIEAYIKHTNGRKRDIRVGGRW